MIYANRYNKTNRLGSPCFIIEPHVWFSSFFNKSTTCTLTTHAIIDGFLTLKIWKTRDCKWFLMLRFVYLCKLLTLLHENFIKVEETQETWLKVHSHWLFYVVMRNVLRAHLRSLFVHKHRTMRKITCVHGHQKNTVKKKTSVKKMVTKS